jgi:predicted RNA binding protein YcfA (HicA-like mRNA interferase family)
MSKLPSISPDDCIKVLMKAGFTVSRQRGSHVQMRRKRPATGTDSAHSNR